MGDGLRLRAPGELLSRARAGANQWLERRGLGLAGLADQDALALLSERPAEALRDRWAHPWLSVSPSPAKQSLQIPRVEIERLGAIAEDACHGRFRLLGYRFLDFGAPVDWHLDPVHQRRAPMRHWSRVPYLDPDVVGDHKIIWELNRQQFLATLGQVYSLTNDERYARTAAGYLTEWIAANPPSRGINWSSSLEVGLRAIAWLWCLRHIVHSEAVTPAQLDRILATLVRHGLHVERYLSYYFSPNTHLTGEALSLLYLGTLLPENEATARWRETGLKVLEAELRRQVWDDGVYFEKSTWYQRYTVDFYLHASILREMAGRPSPVWWTERVSAAANVLAAMVRPDGTIPLLGDDDGGCLLNLESAEVTDIRPTLAVAHHILGVPLPPYASPTTPTVQWLLGPQATTPRNAERERGTTAFRVGGIHVFRDDREQPATLVADTGTMGQYGHAHAGSLGFDLTIGSVPVITDPGTFSYVDPARAELRSGCAHSTVTLAGDGSAAPHGPFGWRGRPAVEQLTWDATGETARLTTVQKGWSASAGGKATHERTFIWLAEGSWIVLDRVSDPAGRTLGIALPLGDQVRAQIVRDGRADFWIHDEPMLSLAIAGSAPASIGLEQSAISPCYGVLHNSHRLLITVNPKSAERDTMILLAFSRHPVGISSVVWDAERQTFVTTFSSGREVRITASDRVEWTTRKQLVEVPA